MKTEKPLEYTYEISGSPREYPVGRIFYYIDKAKTFSVECRVIAHVDGNRIIGEPVAPIKPLPAADELFCRPALV